MGFFEHLGFANCHFCLLKLDGFDLGINDLSLVLSVEQVSDTD